MTYGPECYSVLRVTHLMFKLLYVGLWYLKGTLLRKCLQWSSECVVVIHRHMNHFWDKGPLRLHAVLACRLGILHEFIDYMHMYLHVNLALHTRLRQCRSVFVAQLVLEMACTFGRAMC